MLCISQRPAADKKVLEPPLPAAWVTPLLRPSLLSYAIPALSYAPLFSLAPFSYAHPSSLTPSLPSLTPFPPPFSKQYLFICMIFYVIILISIYLYPIADADAATCVLVPCGARSSEYAFFTVMWEKDGKSNEYFASGSSEYSFFTVLWAVTINKPINKLSEGCKKVKEAMSILKQDLQSAHFLHTCGQAPSKNPSIN